MTSSVEETWLDLNPETPVRDLLKRHGVKQVQINIRQIYALQPARFELLAQRFLLWLWELDQRMAVEEAAALDALSPNSSPAHYRGMVRLERLKMLDRLGQTSQANNLLCTSTISNSRQINKLAARISECQELAECPDIIATLQPSTRRREPIRADDPRILYFAHHALPYHNNGYAHRTASIVAALKRRGWDIRIGTRLGFPVDRQLPGENPRDNLQARQTVDGIEYAFSPSNLQNLNTLPPLSYLRAATLRLVEFIEQNRISLIHAASNAICGLPAVAAARACGIPSIYEARGAWEVTRASRDPMYKNSDAYQLDLKLERAAAAGADRFIAINNPVGERYAADPKFGTSQPFQTVPNGIDLEVFSKEKLDFADARANLNLPLDAFLIGYVGSVVDYEGLDLLIEALREIRVQRTEDVRLLIVGDGLVRPLLENIVRHLNLEDLVNFVGHVNQNKLAEYYAAMNVVCIPRRGWPVCELVTPLKPFEALAAGLPIIVSSVKPLEDVVREVGGGLIFEKDNLAALVKAICFALNNPNRLKTIGMKGKTAMKQLRSWDDVVLPIDDVYNELLPYLQPGAPQI
ncbi:glycosyltransferase family 4 protein [Labrenzia sp. PHM005]|uniref:glycosyltransferase family 4 protein n=1 Tax=Labrenzia sp. PHM005 TaxID=2590016 RepID=UPI00113FFBB6|nr:glycosyltransferase family 4 protein [Labrenzia sp. PHM005]QDG76714.1 glycosyltransferase [Labrenzia sp. PHM005]